MYFFNNGAIVEKAKKGDEIKWPQEHWSQDPNLIEENEAQIIAKENYNEVKITFSTKWMAFHQRVTLREIDPIEVILDIEETPQKILTFYYFNDWWTRPGFIHDTTEIKENTCIILTKNSRGYTCMLAMPGENFSARFTKAENTDEIKLILTAEAAGYANVDETIMLELTDNDPYEAIRKCMEAACSIQNIKTIKDRQYPKAFEKIGWCSWDAFYQEVNEDGLIAKANEIKDKSIPFGWMLIDDGWLDSEDNKLKGYDADKKKFPNGLKACVDKMKEISNVENIGVWHAFSGYWGGIEKNSEIYGIQAKNLVNTKQERILPKAEEDAAWEFYDGWHKYLSKQGINFIKVDSQSSLRNHYRNNSPIGKSAKELHKALDKSAYENMAGNLINCMGMAMENVLSRPQSAVSRSSDDFVPQRENGFEEHMLQNVYNSLYHNAIYYGDWDMFWTTHEDADKHALLRALSGGPIYVSDKVGETKPEILKKLCYSDGTILRASQAAVPTEDCLFTDPLEAGYIKIKNTCNDVDYLAIYAFGEKEAEVEFCVNDCKKPMDIKATCNDENNHNVEISADLTNTIADQKNKYAVYCPITDEIFVTSADEKHTVKLDKKGYIYYQIAQIKDGVAIFGTKEHYLSSQNVKSYTFDNEKIEVKLHEEGTLVLYNEGHKRSVITGI